MNAEIVSVGTELLLGEITDTNATFLAQELSPLGIDLYYVSQVGDNIGRLVEVLARAWGRSDLTIVTGGVGPTDDDTTREAIARLLGEEPVVDADLLEQVARLFRQRGGEMPAKNRKQAWLIPSAAPLPNPIGTAPGWFIDRDGRMLVSMPGVPREMYRMWREQALPRIKRHLPLGVLVSRTLKTIGIGESAAEEALGELVQAANPSTATYAKEDGVYVRIAAKAATEAAARAMIAPVEAEARRRLGDTIYGVDGDTLPGALLGQAAARGLTLATCDVETGARLATLFGEDAAAPGRYRGGLVLDLAGAAALVGGAADDLAALAVLLATRARADLGADAGMTVLAQIADAPEPGTTRHRGVLALATDLAGRTASERREYTSSPAELRRRAILWGAEFLRRELSRGRGA
ncbi:MAG TPA: CinA family nicotinamide mononucleotide deamidase-related protein [Thermomicrobiales bacterium]|nr:CinA family nicotinamide mononucleotide deamidase-related protein [Thermomicrobiales bacterium]